MSNAIEAQRQALRPASDAEIAQACKALLLHADVIGMNKIPDASNLLAVWKGHCRDMPAQLLTSGLQSILKHWKNTFCLPAPGAVWEIIEPELIRMRADLATMEGARRQTEAASAEPEDRGPSSETDAVIAETLRVLRAAGGKGRAA